jgi:hypothetical protein
MKVKDAGIRALRTIVQAAAAAVGVFYAAVAADGVVDIVEIKAKGEPLAYGIFLAVVAATIAFLQNLTEDNTDLNVPKG